MTYKNDVDGFSSAEECYERFRAQESLGEAPDFEVWCALHPELKDRMRILRACEEKGQAIADSLPSLPANEERQQAPEERNTPLDESTIQECFEAIWSKYCPTCRARRPSSEASCPIDGTALRDLSISTVCPSTMGWPTTEASIHASTDGGMATLRACPECGGFCPPSEKSCPYCNAQVEAGASMGAVVAGLPPVLGGKWKLDSQNGSGYFGIFCLGRHAILGMKVGIKVLKAKFVSTELGRNLFHQEAMRVSLLKQTNIVQVFDYGDEAGRPYLVMEFLSGRPLHKYISGKGEDEEIELRDGIEVVRQATIAVAAAHKGVGVGSPLIHLDLKPEHIFVEKLEDGWHVKVIDFGIAEIASAEESTNGSTGAEKEKRIAGTLPYMAPERFQGVVDPRCDIYALGIILYELVAGRRPFDALNPQVWRELHKTQTPAPPSRHRLDRKTPHLKKLDELILWTLKKKPAERPASADVLAEKLAEWLELPPPPTPWNIIRRVSAVVAPVAVLMALLFYLAPWEKVLVDPKSNVLGSKRPIDIAVTVSGNGYEGASVSLDLLAAAKKGTVPLGKINRNNSLSAQLTWENLRDALGEAFEETTCNAQVSVRGFLGRSIVSQPPFKLALDDKPPVFKVLEPSKEIGEDLWISVPTLTIRSADGEPFDRIASRLKADDRDVPPISAEDMESRELSFEIPQNISEMTLIVSDVAGNSEERKWKVKSGVAPQVRSSHEVFSNQPQFVLDFELDRSPGKLQVRIDDEEPLDLILDEKKLRFTLPKPLSYDESAQGAQSKKVEVLTWSDLPGQESRSADGRDTISVSYLRRELEVKERLPEEPENPNPLSRAFELRESGKRDSVEDKGTEWEALASLDDGSSFRPLEAVFDAGARRLTVSKPEGLKGRVVLQVLATDVYGNKTGVWVDNFPVSVERPDVKLTLSSPEGTVANPLHHQACPCREKQESPKKLSFQAEIKYQFKSALTMELRLGDPMTGPLLELDPQDRDVGRYTISELKLLPHLRPGESFIYLRASHSDLNASAYGTCSIFYDPQLTYGITPQDAQPLPYDASHVEVKVQVKGPKVGVVQIAGLPGYSASAYPGQFSREVNVDAQGTTDVKVIVRLANGCKIEETKRYWRNPAIGIRYRFRIDSELPELTLCLQSGTRPNDLFWFVPQECAVTLWQRFQTSKKGQAFYQSQKVREALLRYPSSEKAGISWYEAKAVASWLTGVLRREEIIRSNERADLPSFAQIRLLYESPQTLVPRDGMLCEWLSTAEESRVDGWPVSAAKTGSKRPPHLMGAERWADKAAFRIVLPYEIDGNKLSPKWAVGKNAAMSGPMAGDSALGDNR